MIAIIRMQRRDSRVDGPLLNGTRFSQPVGSGNLVKRAVVAFKQQGSATVIFEHQLSAYLAVFHLNVCAASTLIPIFSDAVDFCPTPFIAVRGLRGMSCHAERECKEE